MKIFGYILLWCIVNVTSFVASQTHLLRESHPKRSPRRNHEGGRGIVSKDANEEKGKGMMDPMSRQLQYESHESYPYESKGKGKKKKKKGKGKGSEEEYEDDFDINICETYAFTWILDMQSSCSANPLENDFEGCQCYDAEERIERGEIICGSDYVCPEDCEVCKSCLLYVIEDCFKAGKPTTEVHEVNPPSAVPSPHIPPPTPTIPAPTPSDDTFNLSICSSYSTQWILELTSTCSANALDFDFTDCQCPDAKRRLELGQIECTSSKPCPEDCIACELCLYYIVDGCLNLYSD